MKRNTLFLSQAAIIAAAYLVLTLPFAQFAFGQIQFRLAEALTVLAALTPAAIPGLFLGCLLTNTLFPSGLGMIDIIFGSLATLLAAWLTWFLQNKLPGLDGGQGRTVGKGRMNPLIRRIIVLLPPAVINGLVVGFYLPFLIPDTAVSPLVIAGFMLSIFISECIVIYLIGLPLMLAMQKTGMVVNPNHPKEG